MANEPASHKVAYGESPTLEPWACGSVVVELQDLLVAQGYKLKLDGNFDHLTEAAVRDFQRQQGLRIDGVVGSQTWAALRQTLKPGVRLLQEGYRGADVYELQGLLRVHGYTTVPRNGYLCGQTVQSIKDFQSRHKLKVDGVVGPVTWTLLRGRPLPQPPKQQGWLIDRRRWW